MARPAGASSVDTRAAIHAAGVRLLYERGYHAMGMRDLAASIGIRASSLYNHVPTKQALLVELLTANLTDMLAGVESALAGIDGARARLQAFVAFHLGFHTERREEAMICTLELRSLDAENYAGIVAMRRAYERRLEAILDAGIAEGVFHLGDRRIATFGILAMLTGAATWYRPGGRLSRAALVREYTRLALSGVGVSDG